MKILIKLLATLVLISARPTIYEIKERLIDKDKELNHLVELDDIQKQIMENEMDVQQDFRTYVGGGYMKFASVLLKSTNTFVMGTEVEGVMTCAEAAAWFERAMNMNKAILTMPTLSEPLTVYRSLTFAAEHKPQVKSKYLEVGAIVPVTHFTSTSIMPDIGNYSKKEDYVLKIELPRNFPVRVLITESGLSQGEREILLPFTLDATGKTANYGLQVVKIDDTPFKVYSSLGLLIKRQKYIHLQVVHLETSIAIDFKNIDCQKT